MIDVYAISDSLPTYTALPVHNGGQVCVCQHGRGAHDHYRGGTDCVVCPVGACGRYRAHTPAHRAYSTLRAVLSR